MLNLRQYRRESNRPAYSSLFYLYQSWPTNAHCTSVAVFSGCNRYNLKCVVFLQPQTNFFGGGGGNMALLIIKDFLSLTFLSLRSLY